MTLPNKIGLYAGTFDPVHKGHVSLMERATLEVGLNTVYCMPNRLPIHKTDVADIVHREAMLRLATSHINEVHVVLSRTDYVMFPETIDELELGNAQLYILVGSDAAITLGNWRNSQQIITRAQFIVGVRAPHDEEQVREVFSAIGIGEDRYIFIATTCADFSSSETRARQREFHPKIAAYIRKHGLYKV